MSNLCKSGNANEMKHMQVNTNSQKLVLQPNFLNLVTSLKLETYIKNMENTTIIKMFIK